MRPRPEWLETFIAIAETGSLTRAAERTARSQSAISIQLRRLEAVAGAMLFERDTRSVRLTAAGERLLPRAHRALEASDAALDAARGQARRTLRVGVPDEYADRVVPLLLDGVSRHEPLAFEVQCAASGELERRVAAKRLDLAFGLAEEIERDGEPLIEDPVVWFQAPGSVLAGERPLPVALFDHACSWRSRAIEALDAAGLDYRVVFTSPSVAGLRAGIRAGFAVGALARSTAGGALEPVPDAEALPALPVARLVTVGAGSPDPDVAGVLARVRRGLTG